MSSVTAITPTDRVDRVRAEVNVLIDTGEVTAAQICRESGLGSTVLSQFRNNKYPGDNMSVADKLQNWRRTRDAQASVAADAPEVPPFVLTPTAARIMEAIEYAHHMGDIVLIYGGAGVGKTETIREYQREHTGVCVVEFTPAHNTMRAALDGIAGCVNVEPGSKLNKTFDAVATALAARRGLLICDEAQHLGAQCLDMIRAIHDRARCGIVYAGNELVYSHMTGGDRAAYLDRLHSRVGMRRKIGRPTQGDADAITAAWRIDDAELRQLGREIAAKPGGLRSLTKTLRLAHMLRGADDLAAKHVRAAFKRLGSGE